MKNVILILLALSLSSCKSYIIKKYCNENTADTTIIKTDTIVLDSTRIDTVFSSIIDSIYVQQGKLSIKYIKVRDSVYLSGKYDTDTIYRTDTIRVSIPVLQPNCKRTWLEELNDARWWVFIAFLCGTIAALFLKR